MAELLPLLTHLDAADARCAPLRLDRFSPFHARAERLRLPANAAVARLLLRVPARPPRDRPPRLLLRLRLRRRPQAARLHRPVQRGSPGWWTARARGRAARPRLDAQFDDGDASPSPTRAWPRGARRHRLDGRRGARARAVRLATTAARRCCGRRTSPDARREVRAALDDAACADRLVVDDRRQVPEPAGLPEPARPSMSAHATVPMTPFRKPLLPSHYSVWFEPPDEAGDEVLHIVSERRSLKLKGCAFREFTRARACRCSTAGARWRRSSRRDRRRLPRRGPRRVPRAARRRRACWSTAPSNGAAARTRRARWRRSSTCSTTCAPEPRPAARGSSARRSRCRARRRRRRRRRWRSPRPASARCAASTPLPVTPTDVYFSPVLRRRRRSAAARAERLTALVRRPRAAGRTVAAHDAPLESEDEPARRDRRTPTSSSAASTRAAQPRRIKLNRVCLADRHPLDRRARSQAPRSSSARPSTPAAAPATCATGCARSPAPATPRRRSRYERHLDRRQARRQRRAREPRVQRRHRRQPGSARRSSRSSPASASRRWSAGCSRSASPT